MLLWDSHGLLLYMLKCGTLQTWTRMYAKYCHYWISATDIQDIELLRIKTIHKYVIVIKAIILIQIQILISY